MKRKFFIRATLFILKRVLPLVIAYFEGSDEIISQPLISLFSNL